MSCMTFNDDESLIPLIFSPISSMENLANVIGSMPYVLINPHTFDGVPLQENIQTYREALQA